LLKFAARKPRVLAAGEASPIRSGPKNNMAAGVLSWLEALDGRILVALNQIVSRSRLLDLFVAWVIDAHIIKFLPFLVVMCWLWFVQTPARERNRQIVLEGVVSAFIAIFAARILALTLPFRDRPIADPELHLIVPFDAGLRTWSSFPSDHAVVAFALAASLYRASPLLGIWGFLHAAILICLPRLYFALHYPSDVVAGALLGIAIAAAVAHLPRRDTVAKLAFGVERQLPSLFYTVAFFTLFELAEMFDSVRILAVHAFRVLRQVLS